MLLHGSFLPVVSFICAYTLLPNSMSDLTLHAMTTELSPFPWRLTASAAAPQIRTHQHQGIEFCMALRTSTWLT